MDAAGHENPALNTVLFIDSTHQKMKNHYRYIFYFLLFGTFAIAQQPEFEYRETPVKKTKAQRDTLVFYSGLGFQQTFGLRLDGVSEALQNQNIQMRTLSNAPLMGSFSGYFQIGKLLLGAYTEAYSRPSDLSPGTASFTFSSSSFLLGYRLMKYRKWSAFAYGGISAQTALVDVELQSPPVNFNTALSIPTKTSLLHIGLGGHAGLMAVRPLGKIFYIGIQAGYAGPLADLGWFYNNIQLSDGPAISTQRGYLALQFGLRMGV